MLRARPAEVSDASAIVEIMRSEFPRKLLSYTVFGCGGVERYVRDSIRRQSAGTAVWYLFESQRSQAAAVAEVRRTQTSLFLNQIFVRRSERGKGIGRRLMFHGLHASRDLNQPHVELDVLADNSLARRIYRSLGFQRVFEQLWMEMPLSDGGEHAGHPEDLDQANRTHREYGFSEFSLHVGSQTYRIGRLGGHLFRTKQRTVLADRSALATLRRLDPQRRVLCIDRTDSASPPIPEKAVEKARTIRLVASLDHVLNRLSRFAFF